MVRPSQQLHPWIEPVATRPAATVLLLRDGTQGLEVLMTRRSLTASFAPGAYVFPGGGIDASDAATWQQARQRPGQPVQQGIEAIAAIPTGGVKLRPPRRGTPPSPPHRRR